MFVCVPSDPPPLDPIAQSREHSQPKRTCGRCVPSTIAYACHALSMLYLASYRIHPYKCICQSIIGHGHVPG